MSWYDRLAALFGGAPPGAPITPVKVSAPPVIVTPRRPITLSMMHAAGANPTHAGIYLDPINEACERFDIVTTRRASYFLAQVAHESGGFRYTMEIWGPTPAQRRYEGRLDLGNILPGDGYRFRGRGLIQITGRANTEACLAFFGAGISESWLTTPEGASLSAGWFWARNGCNEIADDGDFVAITRRINGGTNGLDDRRRRLEAIQQVL